MPEFDPRFFEAHYGEAQPVALIGAGCRFAGASDPFAFWRRLSDGETLSRPVTAEDLTRAGFDPGLLDQPGFVPVASVVEEAEAFDAEFFGTSPAEAASIDPQQRLFLTCAWEALEMAGLAGQAAGARIGVFGAARMSTYALPTRGDVLDLASPLTFQRLIGNDKDYLASRVAYKLGLTGPALTVQTACSSSLVAIHVACEQLRSGECDLALAGGAALTFPMDAGYRHRPGMIFSADGRCRPFDAQADGTFVGNGVAVVLLKPLRRALEDGDPVIAVLRGSAVNNDGSGKAGYTAPSLAGQQAVIEEALALSGLSPDAVGMVETHGTGTPLGDPIEIEALARAFGSSSGRQEPCVIGALKANTGHLDTTAGVAALLKAAFAVREGQIPPLVNFREPNPALRLEETPFIIPQALMPWPARQRVAGVSAFGIGGTNCHVVVERLPPELEGPAEAVEASGPFLLSARDEAGLRALAARHAERLLDGMPEAVLPAYVATLSAARTRLPHRLAVAADDPVELGAILRDVAEVGAQAPALVAKAAYGCTVWGIGITEDALDALLREDRPRPRDIGSRLALAPVALLAGRMHRSTATEAGTDISGTDQWNTLAAAARASAANRAAGYDWSGLSEEERGVAALHAIYVARAFSELGVFADPAARLDRDAVMRAGGIPERFRDLVGRLLRGLAAEGCLTRDGVGYGNLREPVPSDPDALLDGMRRRGYRRLADLVARTGPQLAAMLSGSGNPVSIVFPGGASDDVEEMYERQRDSLYLNAIAADAVAALVAERPAQAPLRVLEIGAGTGGTTSALLPVLPPERTAYTFTDLGPLFLRRAERKFAAYPFLRFAPFDLEDDPAAQGFSAASFDLIVAANVIHNARDLKAALARQRALLAPGGVLLLREITRPKPLFDFVFGPLVPELADSEFRDGELFPSLTRWGEALSAAGFAHWSAAVGEDLAPFALGEQILIARAPEARRQALTPAAAEPPAQDAASLLAALVEGKGDGHWTLADLTFFPRSSRAATIRGEAEGRLFLRDGASGALLAQARHAIRPAPVRSSSTDGSFTRTEGGLRVTLARALSAFDLEGPLTIDALSAAGSLGAGLVGYAGTRRTDGRIDLILADEADRPVLHLVGAARWDPAAASLHGWTWAGLEASPPLAPSRVLTFDGAPSPTARRLGLGPDDAATAPVPPADDRVLLDLSGRPTKFGAADYARLIGTLDRLGAEGAAIDILTTGALAALPAEPISRPDLAGLVGLLRVLRRERPALRLRLVDSDAPLAALPAERAGEDLLAHRAGSYLAPRLVPVHCAQIHGVQALSAEPEATSAQGSAPQASASRQGTRARSSFDGDALHILTGGLSPLALTLAEDLAERGARRLWLLSRRPADPAERHRLDLMRGGGAEVRLLDAIDVGEAHALDDALEAACAAPGRIGRIYHLAGILDDGPLADFDAARLDRVLAAKVEGARTLIAALPRLRPEALVLFSSAATLFGPPGQGAHALANAILEGLATQAAAEGWAVKALAWGFWDEGRTSRAELGIRLAEQGMRGLAPAEGIALLEAALAQPEPVLAPMCVDWERLQLVGALPNAFSAFRARGTEAAQAAASGRADPAASPSVEAHLRRTLGALLKVDPAGLDGDANLVALGLDSLMFLEFSQGLKRDLGIEVSAETALRYDTLNALAAHLGDRGAAGGGRVAATLRRELAALLRRPEAEIDPVSNLVQLGMDSLIFLELTERIDRALGVRISAETALQHDTLGRLAEAIEAQLGESAEQSGPADPLRRALAALGGERPGLLLDNGDLRPDPSTMQFALSPLQRDGFQRRARGRLGGIARHLYVEYDKPAAFDLAGFERAWNRVVARHPALRTEIDPDGTCRILPAVPPYRIECEDVRALDPAARDRRLAALRERMSHQRLNLAMWPHFELRATRIDAETIRLHLDIDTTMVDIESFQVILREIDVELRQSGRALPPLGFSPADYRRGATLVADHAPAVPSVALPPPDLPLEGRPDALDALRFAIRREALPRGRWLRIRETGAARGLTPSAVLLSAFGAALAPWLGSQTRFALGLAYFDRKPLHAEVMNLVVDASAIMPVTLDIGAAVSFFGLADTVQAQIDGRLALGSFDTPPLNLPVVFTSLLGLRRTYALPESADPTLGMPSYEYAAQPGCVLHAQALEEQRELLFNLDWVEGLLPDLAGEALTIGFGAVLDRLAGPAEAWQVPLARLSPADPDIDGFRAQARETLVPAWTGAGL
ncbi:beta-ketoacyl synthase N-terminal-like domain-containing protein [Methylobacterium sp. R2-1]|uniref:beta-ketoacyl synthase N-terminal-like domain-containing protein n=1 Tax=Methylobacterium sp. R2-1 TaxID=2587064 RepID=UPI00160D6A47|nr:beta-ketoacyl synthase N-terminal-like domain-containing protein [Methylobacterium sp. R2-1]MBB2964983.1 yersiniabactin nonribosomal peptide/polyketide synthase [Methylobacterium sp. R2-1]